MAGEHLQQSARARIYRGSILGLSSSGLAACSGGILDPLGPVGAGNATILVNSTVIMLAIVVPTIILALWVAWHFRASNPKAEYLPYWSYSGRIEAVVWSIPTLTILFISGLIWIGTHRLDPFRPLSADVPPLEVQVISLDWKWLFIYPEQRIATINRLVLPAETPVRFSITSASVFNAFFVPRLGSMIYAMPAMVSQLHLQADEAAEIWGISAQFSGDGFTDMQFGVQSMPTDEFDAWTASVRSNGPALDEPTYVQLMQQTLNVPPMTYRAVDPELFQRVVTQKIPPGPGPTLDNERRAGREMPAGRN